MFERIYISHLIHICHELTVISYLSLVLCGVHWAQGPSAARDTASPVNRLGENRSPGVLIKPGIAGISKGSRASPMTTAALRVVRARPREGVVSLFSGDGWRQTYMLDGGTRSLFIKREDHYIVI